jgi:hypothetical protein
MVTSGQEIDVLREERQTQDMAQRELIVAEQVTSISFAYLQTLRGLIFHSLLCLGCKAENSEGAAVVSGENRYNAGALLQMIRILIRFVGDHLEQLLIPLPINQESLTASSLQHQSAIDNAESDHECAISKFLLQSTQLALGCRESFMTTREAVFAADTFDAEGRTYLLDGSDRQLTESRDKGRAELEKTRNDLKELKLKERHDERLKLVDVL